MQAGTGASSGTAQQELIALRKQVQELSSRLASYERMLDRLPGALALIDRAGRFIYANLAFCRSCRTYGNELVGKTIDELGLSTATVKRWHEACATVTSSHSQVRLLITTPVAEGEQISELIVMPQIGDEAQVETFVAMAHDITEQIAVAHRLHMADFALDHAGDSMFWVDKAGRFVHANQSACYESGYSLDEFIGRSVFDLDPTYTRERWGERWALIHSQGPTTYEASYHRKDGSEFPVEVTATYLAWQNHEYLFICARPIAERKRMLADLHNAQEALIRSQLLLNAFVDHAPAPVIVRDAQGLVLIANQSYADLFGIDRAHLVGKMFGEVPAISQAEEFLAEDQLVLATCRTIQVEMTFTLPGGERTYLIHKFPLYDDRGLPVAVGSITTDITELRRAEQRARAGEEVMRVLIENAEDVIMLLDLNGRIRYFHGPARLGMRWDDVNGKTLADLFGNEQGAHMARQSAEVMLSGQSIVVENELLVHGEVFWFSELIYPIRDEAGTLVGIGRIGRNITERKHHEREQALIQRQLREIQRLESLGVMAGGIAHDFNNILTGITGYADMALADLEAQHPAYGHIGEIIAGARRAAELVQQMLAYAGRSTFDMALVDLNTLIREMVDFVSVSVSRKCTLTYLLSEGPGYIEADPTQVRQVLLNLIMNAAEAMDDRPGTVTVATGRVALEELRRHECQVDAVGDARHFIAVEVADTGVGIDEATLARIFDPFFTTKFTGRGLGLAVVLGIVHGHQGAIAVRSAPGRGTTITVFFPGTQKVMDEPSLNQLPVSASEGGRPGGTVLVVDDEPQVRTLAARMVERLGYTTLVAENGRAALELVRRDPIAIDVVLLDNTMPELDGLETTRGLRLLREDLPVILSSGYSEFDTLERFEGLNLSGFLAKPYRLDDLRAALATALRNRSA